MFIGTNYSARGFLGNYPESEGPIGLRALYSTPLSWTVLYVYFSFFYKMVQLSRVLYMALEPIQPSNFPCGENPGLTSPRSYKVQLPTACLYNINASSPCAIQSYIGSLLQAGDQTCPAP